MTFFFWLGADADNDPALLEINEAYRIYNERLAQLVIDTSDESE